MVYDYVLTLGKEIELIWKQRWSLMTILYLSIRYVGLLNAVIFILSTPSVSVSDVGCNIMLSARSWITVIVAAMLDAIMIARLYAMYHGSRKMLTFLVVIFLAVNISCGVIAAMILKHVVGEEAILSGTYICSYDFQGNYQLLSVITWAITAAWEVLALCLALWITAKRFRDLRRLGTSIGSTIGDCLTMLIKSHLLYFAGFLTVACLELGRNSSQISHSTTTEALIYEGFLQIFLNVQMFVLGPRIIISVREYNAKLVNDTDTSTHMTSIAFQERTYVLTSSIV